MMEQRALAVSIIMLCIVALAARANEAPKVIQLPGGGRIVYGTVAGQSTEAGAMGAILRSLHANLGDRPQVGKPFQVRGTNSVAVFFTAVRRTQSDQPVAGMLIVAKVAPDRVEGGLLSDDASRFGATINPMLKTLFGVWDPGAPRAPATVGSAPATELHRYELPDRSASVSLPDGWNVLANSGGGTILAKGRNGELVSLGFPLLVMNSNDPRVRQAMRFAQGAGRNTSYANALYYPYGRDPARTFVDLLQMWREKHGGAPANFQIASETPVQSSVGSRCVHLTGHVDVRDGDGPREMNTVFCIGPLSRMGQYTSLAYHTAVPIKVVAAERATLGYILQSFETNEAVIAAEARVIAGPAIAAIHEIGRRAAQQAIHARSFEDEQAQRFEHHMDQIDRNGQAFSNYLLDQTVIEDTQNKAHTTVWNQTADAMVQHNPQRFGYVDAPNFWKGIDY
jgi:hypothetical protein